MALFPRNSLFAVAILLAPRLLLAARISEIQQTSLLDQITEFFSLNSATVVNTLLGCTILGILGGVLGCFLILRRMALVGDALGHALLPGIALAFLVVGSKSILPLFLGAVIAGVLYSLVLSFVQRQRRVKPDAAIGLTFTAFFGFGIVLMSYIQSSSTGSQSGLDKFLFGQAAALSAEDVKIAFSLLLMSIVLMSIFFRQLKALSFDPTFAAAIGLNVTTLHYGMMVFITLAIVVSVQAVGVVLVSALLIIPGAAAYLLVKRLHMMIILAGVFGLVSGVVGAFLSYVLPGIPTGPVVVLAASALFGLVLLFAPADGIIPRAVRRIRRRQRMEQENLLKAAVEYSKSKDTDSDWIQVADFIKFDVRDQKKLTPLLKRLHSNQLLFFDSPNQFQLTVSGADIGERVLRNHLLWEIYLSEYTDIGTDHVHYDAERIEHVLTPDIVAHLEEILGQHTISRVDPHRSTS